LTARRIFVVGRHAAHRYLDGGRRRSPEPGADRDIDDLSVGQVGRDGVAGTAEHALEDVDIVLASIDVSHAWWPCTHDADRI
jgi:hypothetical protein